MERCETGKRKADPTGRGGFGMTRAGSDERGAAAEGGPFKGKSEDGDVKSPLQNGKMRNKEEKSRSLATLGMTQAGERRKSGPPQKAGPSKAKAKMAT